MLECFITDELPRSSAPRAALELQEPLPSGGFRETWSHCTHAVHTRMHGSAKPMRELQNLLPRADHTEAYA
jgi:hypothetical protein